MYRFGETSIVVTVREIGEDRSTRRYRHVSASVTACHIGFSGVAEVLEREDRGHLSTFAPETPPLLPFARGGAEGGGVILRN
ncbi:MAG: hypothetical protein J7641_14990 [Cyanobacteria bacterium SID2]|nr:hypothetical protein [Cyanobacteria bacterium SID2]MBP0003435.1 hypothetical protein [Cyanobacteria bacterium SBC]